MKWKIAVIISVLFCFSAVAQDEIPEVLFEFTAIPDSMFYLNGQLYLCANPNSEERHSTGLVLALSDDDQKVVVTHGGGWYNRSPSNFVTFNNRLYFQYGEPGRNVMWINYLYTADKNTGALTRLTEYTVGDITPMGDHLFYSRYTLTKGYELMTYNDVEGERVFKDLAPGKPSSWPHNFYAVNNKLFFYAFSADIGYELYVSDGTPDGTRLVKDINVGAGSSNRYTDQKIHVEWEEVDAKDFVYIYPFFSCNNICYFHADDGVHGYELWRTDGTSSGTYLVKDINPGSENAFPYERTTQFRFQEPKVPLRCVYNNEFYFLAKTPANGYELWKTNGTASGTVLLKDINPGAADANITSMLVHNGLLFFSADDGVHGNEIWRTDGTASGTYMLADISVNTISSNKGSYPYAFTIHNGRLYFIASQTLEIVSCTAPEICTPSYIYHPYLYSTDGTTLGTVKHTVDIGTDPVHQPFLLVSTPKGLCYTQNKLDYVFELRRLSTNVPVVFTSQPIIGTSTGSVYTYNISAVDPDDGPITFAATTKPAWLTLVDNGNGTARLSGTPGVAGDFNVELTATSGSSTPVAQSFTIHVENSEVYALKAYSRESDISNPLLSVPRIYIVNSGDAPISGVRYEYYFSTEPDAVGITVDHYYLPNASATFSKISDCFFKLTITPSIPIQSGQVFPSVDGSATGIHYSNWSPFIKDNDYSNNMSSTFKENIRICIYNASNELIWGMPPSVSNVPPVADAGSDISKIDNEGDGEIISFDGSGSYDIDGSVIKYEWMEGGTVLQIGRKAKIKLLKGIHTIVLRVTDNKGLISTDNIMVVISEPGTSTKFTLTPSAIPANTPVTLSYTLPASLNGATVRCLLQREWGILPWNLLGTAGTHNLTIWDWNKYFFGGSGPWNVKFEINGTVVDSKVITFSY